MSAGRISTYRFYFDLGVPVFDWPTGKKAVSHKWRACARNVFAYSLTDATKKLAKGVITKWSMQAKLNLTKAFVSVVPSPSVGKREDWEAIDLDAATLAAFVVGTNAKVLLKV